MQNIYTLASSSSSTTYGNVMAFIKDYIVHLFPIGQFKDVNLTSEIAYVNVKRRLGANTLKEMSKLERPFMVITPQIQIPSGDQYLYDIPLTKNYDNIEYAIQSNTLFPLIVNKADGHYLTYKLNRDQIQFDIAITVDTRIQQIDLYKYMVNTLTWERPYSVIGSLEAMIPREVIKHYNLLENIDIDDSKSNQIPIALQNMNKRSSYPITYKIRNGTSLDEFFMYYRAEMIVTLSDLSMDEISRKNFADDFCQVRFNCSVEFNLPGFFAIIGGGPKPRELEVDLRVKEADGYHDLIPLFTINNFFSRYPSEKNGFIYYANSRFKTDCDNNQGIDHLDISVLFDDAKLDVISRYDANFIPIETLVDIIILKDQDELPNNLWYIDWAKRELTIEQADNDATYRIIIYINYQLFNEEESVEIENLQRDKSKI